MFQSVKKRTFKYEILKSTQYKAKYQKTIQECITFNITGYISKAPSCCNHSNSATIQCHGTDIYPVYTEQKLSGLRSGL